MPQVEFSRSYLKDLRKWRKSGRSLEPLDEFIRTIRSTWPPPARYEPHLLAGSLDGLWDIHLRQNWILLLRFHAGTVRFLRLGTHSDIGI